MKIKAERSHTTNPTWRSWDPKSGLIQTLVVFLNQHAAFPKDVRDDLAQVFTTEEEKEEKKELWDISSEKFFWLVRNWSFPML